MRRYEQFDYLNTLIIRFDKTVYKLNFKMSSLIPSTQKSRMYRAVSQAKTFYPDICQAGVFNTLAENIEKHVQAFSWLTNHYIFTNIFVTNG